MQYRTTSESMVRLKGRDIAAPDQKNEVQLINLVNKASQPVIAIGTLLR